MHARTRLQRLEEAVHGLSRENAASGSLFVGRDSALNLRWVAERQEDAPDHELLEALAKGLPFSVFVIPCPPGYLPERMREVTELHPRAREALQSFLLERGGAVGFCELDPL